MAYHFLPIHLLLTLLGKYSQYVETICFDLNLLDCIIKT